MSLSQDTITFGKYRGQTLPILLKDRGYCSWLLKQDWFEKQYEYLYNRVKTYSPLSFFVKPKTTEKSESYDFFRLYPIEELKITLSETEEKCYEFYLETISSLRKKIERNLSENPYDIKAPTAWLKKFEEKYKISRDTFKTFLATYELPNITSIVEDIKKMGGITYKGAKSFLIAKKNSETQEQFWGEILKACYGEDIGVQFKYRDCIFDFIRIKANILYECKLGLKDFNQEQYNKYLITLGYYSIVYLISRDCIVDLQVKKIFTIDKEKYQSYFVTTNTPTKLDLLIQDFPICEISSIKDYFKQ